MDVAPKDGRLDHNIYSPRFLNFYDRFVLGLSFSHAWKCATQPYLLPFFRKHFTTRHLDVGVGTGYLTSTLLAEIRQGRASLALTSVGVGAGAGDQPEGGNSQAQDMGHAECGQANLVFDTSDVFLYHSSQVSLATRKSSPFTVLVAETSLEKEHSDNNNNLQFLSLFDLSPNSLLKAAERVNRSVAITNTFTTSTDGPGPYLHHLALQPILGDATKPIDALNLKTSSSCTSTDTTDRSKPLLFDSISVFNLLHCMPGHVEEKADAVFSNLARHLTPAEEVQGGDDSSNGTLSARDEMSRGGGVLTGSTILGVDITRQITKGSSLAALKLALGEKPLPGDENVDGDRPAKMNLFGRTLMAIYNRVGIFTNRADTPDAIVLALESHFAEVDSWIVGRVLLFRARKPRTTQI